jgi:hypothetical protein
MSEASALPIFAGSSSQTGPRAPGRDCRNCVIAEVSGSQRELPDLLRSSTDGPLLLPWKSRERFGAVSVYPSRRGSARRRVGDRRDRPAEFPVIVDTQSLAADPRLAKPQQTPYGLQHGSIRSQSQATRQVRAGPRMRRGTGLTGPLWRGYAVASCASGGHRIFWTVEAASAEEALALLPPYLAERCEANEVKDLANPVAGLQA